MKIRAPGDFKINPMFDFSTFITDASICDLHVGPGISLLNCGKEYATFDTVAAF